MKNWKIGVFLLAAYVVLGGLTTQGLAAELPTASVSDEENIQHQLVNEGFADVIVSVNPQAIGKSMQLDAMSKSERNSVVSRMQSGLLSRLSSTDHKILQKFSYNPQMHLHINAKAFEILQQNSEIAISPNLRHTFNLSTSVPRVFRGHRTSPYDGDNRWAVAVLDTGVQKSHAFLRNKVISEACYSGGYSHSAVNSLCPGGVRSSTKNGSGVNCSGIDGCSHGTHVAGIVAGYNSSMEGVADKGKVISIQVYSKISGTNNCYPYPSPCLAAFSSDIISALERVYALRNTYNIAAVNMSLGGGSYSGYCNSESRRPIIRTLKSAGIATIVSSGNDYRNYQISAPACIQEAIAVGASYDNSDTRARFSNNSPALDLYAPGAWITSSVVGGGYAAYQGTSMATPHVAGAWAVLRHAKPSASVDEIESLLKSLGPGITVLGVTRKRIDITAALTRLAINPAASLPAIIYLLLLND